MPYVVQDTEGNGKKHDSESIAMLLHNNSNDFVLINV